MDDGDEEESDLTSISCMVGRLVFMNSLVLLRLAVTHLLQNTETLLFPQSCCMSETKDNKRTYTWDEEER